MNMHFPFLDSSLAQRTRHAPSERNDQPRPQLAWPTCHGAEPARRCLLISPCGVLFDDSVWSRWLLQLLARMGLHTHSQAFVEVWRRDYFVDVCFARRGHWEALQAMLIASGLSRGQADEVCAAARPKWREWQASLHAYPQVAPTLSALSSAGVALGIAASSPLSAAELQEELKQLDLAQWFDFVVSSRDEGVQGSLSSLYTSATDAWNCPEDRASVLLVTNRADELAAAGQCGLGTVAAFAAAPPHLPAIERFDQLLALAPSHVGMALAS